MKKIKNMMVAVTASWCGACHNISDDLNKAIRDPNNTSPGTRIDEKLLSKFNRGLKTPIEPPHYPYFIVIDEQGTLKEVLETMDDVKQFLKSPKSSASTENTTSPLVPSPVNTITPSYVPSPTVEEDSDSDEEDEEDEKEEAALSKKFESMSISPDLSLAKLSATSGTQSNSAIQPSPMTMQPVSGMPTVAKGASGLPPNSLMSSAIPPSSERDAVSSIPTNSSNSRNSNSIQKGGCVYSSIASVAYQLATPAALLGIAAATLRKRRGRKGQRSKRNKGNQRNKRNQRSPL